MSLIKHSKKATMNFQLLFLKFTIYLPTVYCMLPIVQESCFQLMRFYSNIEHENNYNNVSVEFINFQKKKLYQNTTMLSFFFSFFCVCCLATNIDLSKKKKKSCDLGIASGDITLSFFFLIPS